MQAQQYIDLVKSTLDALDPKALDALVEAFHTTYEKGGNIYTMGNGCLLYTSDLPTICSV